MTVEGLKTIFDWAAVILLFFTFVFGVGVLITGNVINARQSERLRQFDKDLTGAKTALATQQERAANADARVAGLETDAANAKSEMAKQQTRAANAEKALLELQQRLAHRRISKSDHNQLVASLRPYRGSVVNLTKLGDAEAAQFADDIIAVLVEARWRVNVSTFGIMSPPRYGLICSVDTESSAGQSLATALRTLPTSDVKIGPHPGVMAEILVGLRPPA
jgi:hypothetical protein